MSHQYSHQHTKQKSVEPTYRMAKVLKMFDSINTYDNVRVIDGSDEEIFEETYVTCVLAINNRVVKFKKNVLEFL